jgi:hypothetical protein
MATTAAVSTACFDSGLGAIVEPFQQNGDGFVQFGQRGKPVVA